MKRTLMQIGLVAALTLDLPARGWTVDTPPTLPVDAPPTQPSVVVEVAPAETTGIGAPTPPATTASGWGGPLELMAVPRGSSEVRRWREFDAEFGIDERSSSLMKGTLQQAKYNLDRTVFDLDQLVNNLENALEFEFSPRDLTRAGMSGRPTRVSRSYFSPLHDIWENSRFQSTVDLELSGRAFVGFTFQFPFGN